MSDDATTEACPVCDSHRVFEPAVDGVAYRCRDCGATFGEPVVRARRDPKPPTCKIVRNRGGEMRETAPDPHHTPLRCEMCRVCWPGQPSLAELAERPVTNVQYLRSSNNRTVLHRVPGARADKRGQAVQPGGAD